MQDWHSELKQLAELKERVEHRPVLVLSNGFRSLTTFVHKLEQVAHVHLHCLDLCSNVGHMQVQTVKHLR